MENFPCNSDVEYTIIKSLWFTFFLNNNYDFTHSMFINDKHWLMMKKLHYGITVFEYISYLLCYEKVIVYFRSETIQSIQTKEGPIKYRSKYLQIKTCSTEWF